MLSNPLDDEDRFKVIIDAAITAGEAEPFDAYYNIESREKRKEKAEKESKEAQDYAKELGVYDAFFGNGRSEGKEKAGLADLIQQKQKARAATFLDDLTAKYVNGAGKNGKTKGRKRTSEEEEEDVAKPKKKGRLTKKGKAAKRRVDEYESEAGEEDEVENGEPPVDEPSEETLREGSHLPSFRPYFL